MSVELPEFKEQKGLGKTGTQIPQLTTTAQSCDGEQAHLQQIMEVPPGAAPLRSWDGDWDAWQPA